MIPQRLALSGFLSYTAEQTFDFTDAPIWMLSGANGSGKSGVFDAITFALFGCHRGGATNAVELINKESTGFVVDFEFRLDGEQYRAKRTLKRATKGTAASTQQLFRFTPTADNDQPGWIAVSDTNKKVDFDAWIREHIGLNYETFTSSVLLLQGKAEKLLDATAKGRFEVLAGIVDLERYQKLHEAANRKKLKFKNDVDHFDTLVEAVLIISDEELAVAKGTVTTTEAERTSAQEKIDEYLRLADLARRWTETQVRLTAAREKLTKAEAVLGDAVKIENDFARLTELKAVLPAVHQAVTTRGTVKSSKEKTTRYEKERVEAHDAKSAASHDLAAAKDQRTTLKKQQEADQTKQLAVGKRLQELAGVLQTVKLLEDERALQAVAAAELAKLPAEPATAVRDASATVERLGELQRIVPVLERIHTERSALVQSRMIVEAESKLSEEKMAAGLKLKEQRDSLAVESTAVTKARGNANDDVAAAVAMEKQAKKTLADLGKLADKSACTACGQTLTKTHLAAEKILRAKAATEAEAKVTETSTAQATAIANEKELVEQLASLDAKLVDLREQYKDAETKKKQAEIDSTRHANTLKLSYGELPDEYRQKIAAKLPSDWTTTRFPARDEVSTLRTESATLDAAKKSLTAAQKIFDTFKDLRSRSDSATQRLAKLSATLPAGDAAALRAEQTSKTAEETSFKNSLAALRKSLETIEIEIDKQGRLLHDAERTLVEKTADLKGQEELRVQAQETIARAVKGLPAEWQARVEKAGLGNLTEWQDEQDRLIAADTAERHRQLEQARAGLENLRDAIAQIETEDATFPPESRRATDEVKQLLATARATHALADEAVQEARKHVSRLEGYRVQRSELGDKQRAAQAEHAYYKTLSDLLGRDRLQRHLVRQAERQIIDCANGVLSRISSGDLFLKLIGSDDGTGGDKALELEAMNSTTGSSPINVSFLSGSQKFRVAVALALGIGQYASRRHRPIESVIIDEGFGCLDRNGRQVMIQELQNLRGHLHCILLVSHQEEFADAFSNGYRFELRNGASRVERFRR